MSRGNKKYAFDKTEILSSYPMTDIVALVFIISSLPHLITCILLFLSVLPEYLCYYLKKFFSGRRHHAKPITRIRPDETKSRAKLNGFVSDFLMPLSFNAIILLIIESKLLTTWIVYLTILSNAVVASELIGHSQPSSLLEPDIHESKGDSELQSSTISVVPLVKKEQLKYSKSVQQTYADSIKSRRYVIAKKNIINALICFCAVLYIDYFLGKAGDVAEYIQLRYFARHIVESSSSVLDRLVEFIVNFRWKPICPLRLFFNGTLKDIRGTYVSVARTAGTCFFARRKYSQYWTYNVKSICGIFYFPLLARAIMNIISFLMKGIEHLHNLLSVHIIMCEVTSLFPKRNAKTVSNPLLGHTYFTNLYQNKKSNQQNFHAQGNNSSQYHSSCFNNRKLSIRVLNVVYSNEKQEGLFYARLLLNSTLLDVVFHNVATYFKSQFCEESQIYTLKLYSGQVSQGNENSRNLMPDSTRQQENLVETTSSVEHSAINSMKLAEPLWGISAMTKIIINNTRLLGQSGVETEKALLYPRSISSVQLSALFIGDDRVILRLADRHRRQDLERGSNIEVYVNAVKWVFVENYVCKGTSQSCLCIYGLCPSLQYSIEVYQFTKGVWILLSHRIINTVSSSDKFSTESRLCTTLKTLQSSLSRSLWVANDRKHMIKKTKKDDGRKMAEAHKEVELLRNRIEKCAQNNRNSNRKKGFEHSLLHLKEEIGNLSILAKNISSARRSIERYYESELERQEEQIYYLQNLIQKHENAVFRTRRLLQTTEKRRIQLASKNSKLSAKLKNTTNDIENAKNEIEHLKRGSVLSKLQKLEIGLEERTLKLLLKIDISVKQLDNLATKYQPSFHRRGGNLI